METTEKTRIEGNRQERSEQFFRIHRKEEGTKIELDSQEMFKMVKIIIKVKSSLCMSVSRFHYFAIQKNQPANMEGSKEVIPQKEQNNFKFVLIE